MSEYAYISKDESYALKHYGVKGMKWHKHLKARFDRTVGFTDRRALEDTGYMRYKSMLQDPNSERTKSLQRQEDYRRSKYAKTPLGKLEKASMKLDRGDDSFNNKVDNLLSQKTKSKKRLDREAKRRVRKRDRKLEKVYKKIDDDYRNQNKLGNGMTMVRLAELPSARRIQKENLAVAKSREIAKEYANRDKTSALKVQQRRNLKRANAQKSLEEAKERRKRKYVPVQKWKRKRID